MLKIIIYNDSTYNHRSDVYVQRRSRAIKKEVSLQRSVRRTRSTIKDVILSNEFDLWCTFTFDQAIVDRYDIARCKQKMSTWLFNQRKHSPDMKYLIVPEFHKKCKECVDTKQKQCPHNDAQTALHYHALISGYNGKLTLTRLKTSRKQPILKFSGYRSGRSQAVKITQTEEDYKKVANYLQKYITKDMPLLDNKRRYWRSNNLNMPITTINGILKYNLQNIIKNNNPSFINEYYEIQHHPISTKLTTDPNMVLL